MDLISVNINIGLDYLNRIILELENKFILIPLKSFIETKKLVMILDKY